MSKRRDSLTVSEDLSNVFYRKLERKQVKGLSIEGKTFQINFRNRVDLISEIM